MTVLNFISRTANGSSCFGALDLRSKTSSSFGPAIDAATRHPYVTLKWAGNSLAKKVMESPQAALIIHAGKHVHSVQSCDGISEASAANLDGGDSVMHVMCSPGKIRCALLRAML